jgi:hypothetical protein
MIKRDLEKILLDQSKKFPIVYLYGPRQSGKTTLCKKIFSNKKYINLESLDMKEYAEEDPRGFLNQFSEGVILDEIQNTPNLFNYLQEIVDDKKKNGLYILIGSQNFILSEKISQSLAGRVSILTLLPPDYFELKSFPQISKNVWKIIFQGSYPRIYDQNIPAQEWLNNYVLTYLQKDIRQICNIKDLNQFQKFLTLLASYTGQELNLNNLGNDIGISHNTCKKWISLLISSFIIKDLPAFHFNIRKQITKRPKIHFLDTGLVCFLLKIKNPDQLKLHPLRGAIFETWVVSEIYKKILHKNTFQNKELFYYRENKGVEIDLIIKDQNKLNLIEIKSAETFNNNFVKSLFKFKNNFKDKFLKVNNLSVIYNGLLNQQRSNYQVINWKNLNKSLDL